jgi:hypothetical protein
MCCCQVSIAYGSTELLSAGQFLAQLAHIGRPANGDMDLDSMLD